MENNKYEREEIGYYVLNSTGEITPLYSDQYIVDKKERREQHSEIRIRKSAGGRFMTDEQIKAAASENPAEVCSYPFDNNKRGYFRGSNREIKALLPELNVYERSILLAVLPSIDYSGCVLLGKRDYITLRDFAAIGNMGERKAREASRGLHKKRILLPVLDNGKYKYILNPFVAGKGKHYQMLLQTLFADYEIRSEKMQTIREYYKKR